MPEWPPWKPHDCKVMAAVLALSSLLLVMVELARCSYYILGQINDSQFKISQSAIVLKALVMEQQEAEEVVGVVETGGDKAWLVPRV